ncbi:MAG: hypothetical protein GF383_03950 [Candidatus Lokiarchaeota archaeon]|nr:hypothetical protein [Candidatus Lokiarchaeota archaeon]MBD3338878.1 hypothetical protein [Candidatus Lokiarchaeota archaeon]
MAVDIKLAAIGALIVGMVAMAGWVGFLYVNPVTRTKTEEDEETVYVPTTVTEETGLPDDWGLADYDATFTVYNETGGAFEVTMADIFNGISLYYNQEADPQGRETQEFKYEYMELLSVDDPLTGRTFTGVNILDVLEFAQTFYAWNFSCKTKNMGNYANDYFNTSTADVVKDWDSSPMIVAIAADGVFLPDLGYGNFSVIRTGSTDSVYDLEEIRALDEWEIDIYINGTLSPYKINRTNVIDNNYPSGWHYEYYKYPEKSGGRMNFNRTYIGRNMSSLINNTNAKDYNYELQAIAIDDWASVTLNNTDINFGLVYPENYGYVNKSGGIPAGGPYPLPETDNPIVISYREKVFTEYGLFPTDPPYDKFYNLGYFGGPYQLIIPGQTSNKYSSLIDRIEITIYTGPIP